MEALASVMQRLYPGATVRRTGFIGVECALHALHLVQLSVDAAGEICLQAHATLDYPCDREELFTRPREFRVLMRSALAQGGFRGRAVVTTLPSADVRIMPVSYQLAEGGADDAAVLDALVHRLDGDVRDYVIDYLPVRAEEGMDERMAIVAVARREHVIRYLELLRRAGLDVRHLEIGPAAIRRLVGALGAQGEHHNVLAVNFGRESSYLTIISGARLLFDQETVFGENSLLELIASTLDMTAGAARRLVTMNSLDPWIKSARGLPAGVDREASLTLQEIVKPAFLKLAEEINRTLIYAASQTRGEPVSCIYLLGSLARWRGVDAFLNSLVRLDVRTIPDPLQVFCKTARTPATPGSTALPEIAVATGLALNGLT